MVGAMVGASVGGTVVAGTVVAGTVVVAERPCFGVVMTVTPSAMTNCDVSVVSSPMVVTPLISIFQLPGARNKRPASSATRAAPGRVIGTLIVKPE
jgi:hypothetical protein